MKNKTLIIIILILIILLAFFCIVKFEKRSSSNSKQTSRNFILQDNTVVKVNTKGENTGIYVGVNENDNENYLFVSTKIDKTSSKKDQIKSLISEIGISIGYKIDINSVEINEDEIKIDFSKTAAPFELQESYSQTNNLKYSITSDKLVAKTIFDSINKTLKSYFGATTKIYYSVDSENINITNEILTISIDSSEPYKN